MPSRSLSLSFLLALAAAPVVAQPEAVSPPTRPLVAEAPVRFLPLEDDFREAEFSGLAWHGDELVLLAQTPELYTDDGDDGAVFVLDREEIEEYIDGEDDDALSTRRVPFSAPGVSATVEGFEGFEALAFRGDSAFVLIEAHRDGPAGREMMAYVMAGVAVLDGDGTRLGALRFDPNSLVQLPPPRSPAGPVNVNNHAYEALLALPDGRLLVLYEVNGANVNPSPSALVLSPGLQLRGAIPAPRLEYRLTDATAADAEGRFWAMNYFFPGDRALIRPAVDTLAERFGSGPTHRGGPGVERLVEMQLAADGVRLTDTPPIPLVLDSDGRARNWEGLVRMEGRGFLIVTDTHPRTLLAFIAPPGAASAPSDKPTDTAVER